MSADIETLRLILRPLDEQTLSALAAGDLPQAGARLGTLLDAAWSEASPLAAIRLAQLREDPAYAPWSLRAIILRATGEAAGHVNFHERPRYHAMAARPHCAELGYTIYGSYRRRGYGEEMVRALIAWAVANGAENLIFSIAPDNVPSRNLALKFGARKVGTQIDEVDGPEDVYLLEPGTI